MSRTAYYDILQKGLPETIRVQRLVHGVSWTAAVLSDGRCGVAMHTEGDGAERMFPALEGLSVAEAGRAILSWNLEEASEAFAAVNAFYNTPDRACGDRDVKTLDGIDLSGRTVGMVGYMIGHSNITAELLAPAKKVWICDREDKPGALPDSAGEFFLPDCDLVIITGSAAINKTLPRLLELSRSAEIILCGPSVSCCPGLLELGIKRLNGRVITEPEPMLAAIPQKRMSVNEWSLPFQMPEETTPGRRS